MRARRLGPTEAGLSAVERPSVVEARALCRAAFADDRAELARLAMMSDAALVEWVHGVMLILERGGIALDRRAIRGFARRR